MSEPIAGGGVCAHTRVARGPCLTPGSGTRTTLSAPDPAAERGLRALSGGDQMAGDEQWVDLQAAVAMTGVPGSAIAWAMAEGEVRYSTREPGHEHTPLLLLADVEWLALQRRDRPARIQTRGAE